MLLKKLFLILITSLCPLALFAEVQQTLSILKPDAVAAHHIGEIIAIFEKGGLHVAGLRMVKLNSDEAGKFYAVHKDKPFFAELTQFMSSGPVVVMVLEGENAVARNRELMGSTDPKKAAAGTIRAQFAESISKNAVHGSDSTENAAIEIAFFFKPNELFK